MSVYTLDEDEAFITRASDVTVGIFGKADLILTNKNIVQINKGFFGEETGFEKYPLASLKVYNGKAILLPQKTALANVKLSYTSTILRKPIFLIRFSPKTNGFLM